MKNNIKHLLLLSTIASGCISGINKFIDVTSEIKNMLPKHDGNFFEWRYGNIYYTKQGTGSPILLIHDLHPASSSFEWSYFAKKLEKEHTVYTIDLLGCGRSDKPNFTYTNYMYVQLITDFVNKVIGEQTDTIAMGNSCSFTLMAAHMDSTIFDQLFFISPIALEKLQSNPDRQNNFLKKILELPVIGTFFYNIQMSEDGITKLFEARYKRKSNLISGKQEDAYYESAHINHSKGKYLLGSIIGNYTNINIIPALKKIENPIFLIGSDIDEYVMDSYTKYDENIQISVIFNGSRLPQLDEPDKLYKIISMFK